MKHGGDPFKFFLDGWPNGQALPHVDTRSSLGGVNMMPTAELLVVETTRSAACRLPQATEYQEETQEEKLAVTSSWLQGARTNLFVASK